MYFTSGSDRAFEQLMQGKPGFDHYDSGEAVTPEDCGTCRFYRPHWKYQFCVYAECPYQPGKLTAYDAVTFRVKGVENMAVFRVERNKGYTVMSNHHLRNKDLSLKAKGLLSQMLSLPEDWDYIIMLPTLLRTNCVACRYLFRCLSASCFRRIRTAQSGQYFARLDFGVNAAPHTAHRFTLSRLWMISAYSAPSIGRTAAQNHRHSSE